MKKPRPIFKINRFFSRPLTAILLKTPLTPNHVTLLSLGFGAAAAFLFSRGDYGHMVSGAVCLQIAAVLDCCDGEIARAKNLKSKLGAVLDVVVDLAVDLLLFSGIAAGLIRQAVPGPLGPVWGLCVFGTTLNFILVILERQKGFGPAVFNRHHPEGSGRESVLFKITEAASEGDVSWLVLAAAIAGKMDWLFWCAGVYMQVLWIFPLSMNFRWIFLKTTHETR